MRSWSTASAATASAAGTRPSSLLYSHALARGEGRLAEGGPLAVDTGVHTGRSPKDKFIVREPGSESRIWWGEVNASLAEDRFEGLREKVTDYLSARDLYVVDAFAGADPAHRHRRSASSPTGRTTRSSRARCSSTRRDEELRDFEPDALVLHAPGLEADPRGRRHADEHVRRPAPDPPGGADRRHVLRGRDQEVDLHAHERPPAARRRLPDALLGERRRRRATWRSSSASRAPARRRSRPTPSAD